MAHRGSKGRFLQRLKPKQKNAFSAGQVISWNDYSTTRMNPVDLNLNSTQNVSKANFSNVDKQPQARGRHTGLSGNSTDYLENNLSAKKTEWLVYSRPKHDVIRKMGCGNEGILCRDLEVTGDCLVAEDHTIDSSSDYSDSDKEVREVEDTIIDHDRGAAEEAGFEVLRYLLGLQLLEMGTKTSCADEECRTKKDQVRFVETKGGKRESSKGSLDREVYQKNWFECEGEVNGTNLDQKGQGETSDVLSLVLKVGKIGFSSKDIKAVSDALDLKLIENRRVIENQMEKQKNSKNSARRKGSDRKLHSLKCTIDYKKGRKEKGHHSDI